MNVINIYDENYPKNLLKIKNPPQRLYAEGNIKLLSNKCIAMVGSRIASEYGIKYAKIFAKQLSINNITIISGLALGIDTVAHEYSKNNKGGTIAVLGSGLNKIYPKENERLFYEILESNGCIISEYDPNEEANSKNFPKRNRIISGISDGILIVESAYKSGSTITARIGFKQNKEVFCIPRSLDDENKSGTNYLIKSGANIVVNPKDILEKLGIKQAKDSKINKLDEIYELNEVDKKEGINKKKEINNTKSIPKKNGIKQINKTNENKISYIDIYNLITYIPINIEELVKKSELKISELNEKLTILELEGSIKSLPGNNYVRR